MVKVCKKHIDKVKEGTTYQVVPKRDCEICKIISTVGEMLRLGEL